MKILNDTFWIVMGSDVQRDGMYLELVEAENGDEVYIDEKKKMPISIYKPELALESIEILISEAKRRLPSREN